MEIKGYRTRECLWSGSGGSLFVFELGFSSAGANKTGKLLNNGKVTVVTKQIRLLFRQCILRLDPIVKF